MILVDTSVWIDHLRVAETGLAALLGQCEVVMHPMIIGELACGNLQNRTLLLSLWRNLPSLAEATHPEALYFLEQNRLMVKGIGWADLQLASGCGPQVAIRCCGRGINAWQDWRQVSALALLKVKAKARSALPIRSTAFIGKSLPARLM